MYKHAWGLRLTPPKIKVRNSKLEREQDALFSFLVTFATAEITKENIPRLPSYLWRRHANRIRACGGVSRWAKQRLEYSKALKRARLLARYRAKGRSRNEMTRGIGQTTSWKPAEKRRRRAKAERTKLKKRGVL